MFRQIDDTRIEKIRPLLPPAILMEEQPALEQHNHTVASGREQIASILHGKDPRLVVVVGPCSIHDPAAGLEYARRLRAEAERLRDDLVIVMRVYFEKPRTTVGWKGLINDPHLNGSFAINEGLRLARHLLLDINNLGLPAGTEFLDPITPQFIGDLIGWGAIGARTTESQVHRELASGISAPLGFKNGTNGGVQIALDALLASKHPHQFLSVTKQGMAAIVQTKGNPDCHIILRGGTSGPNYDKANIHRVCEQLQKADLSARLMVDCSHANSGKDYAKQPDVATEIARQVGDGSGEIFGLMLESFLEPGRQNVTSSQELTFGQSITDGCMSWEMTLPVLDELARASAKRRSQHS